MKKYLRFMPYCMCLALAACGGYIKNQNGSEYLVKLDGEPIGCTFLYKLEAEVSVYDADDARRYLENRIADQARPGNAYLITSQRTRPNEWVVFGPERAFILAANVYDCPNPRRIQTVDSAQQILTPSQQGQVYPVYDGQANTMPVMQQAIPMQQGAPVYQYQYVPVQQTMPTQQMVMVPVQAVAADTIMVAQPATVQTVPVAQSGGLYGVAVAQ
ncbi:MAG: hypothetical protein K2L95_00135 [Alphaproteobacteria bacterium]|nr:hypothetical protein [Alphaproteobacteria bacterium]